MRNEKPSNKDKARQRRVEYERQVETHQDDHHEQEYQEESMSEGGSAGDESVHSAAASDAASASGGSAETHTESEDSESGAPLFNIYVKKLFCLRMLCIIYLSIYFLISGISYQRQKIIYFDLIPDNAKYDGCVVIHCNCSSSLTYVFLKLKSGFLLRNFNLMLQIVPAKVRMNVQKMIKREPLNIKDVRNLRMNLKKKVKRNLCSIQMKKIMVIT